jgi:hypothetical protein
MTCSEDGVIQGCERLSELHREKADVMSPMTAQDMDQVSHAVGRALENGVTTQPRLTWLMQLDRPPEGTSMLNPPRSTMKSSFMFSQTIHVLLTKNSTQLDSSMVRAAHPPRAN